jgi:hypothetical protein
VNENRINEREHQGKFKYINSVVGNFHWHYLISPTQVPHIPGGGGPACLESGWLIHNIIGSFLRVVIMPVRARAGGGTRIWYCIIELFWYDHLVF